MKHVYTHWIFVIFLLTILISSRILPNPKPKQEQPLLFFQAVNNHTTIYLLGSIHGNFSEGIVYPLPPRIIKALQISNLYLYSPPPSEKEMNIINSAAITSKPWSEFLEEEQIAFLIQSIEALKLDKQTSNRLLNTHPWLVLNLFYQAMIKEAGFFSTTEEMYLLSLVQDTAIIPLDLLPLEVIFLKDISENYAKELYRWSLTRLNFLKYGFNLTEVLQNVWLQGDVHATLDQMVISRTPHYEFLQIKEIKLYEEINQNIWGVITQYLSNSVDKTPIRIFITLSADYLLDEGGFACFLEEHDFIVSRA